MIPAAALAQTPTVSAVVNAQGGTNFGRTIKASSATVQVAGQSIGIIDASPWFDGSSVIGDLLVVQIPANIDPGAVSLVVTVEGRSSVPFNVRLDQYAPLPLVYRG